MKIRLFIGTSNIEDNWIEKNYLYSLFQNSNDDFEVTFLRPKSFQSGILLVGVRHLLVTGTQSQRYVIIKVEQSILM